MIRLSAVMMADGYDCAFGSRFMRGTKIVDYPVHQSGQFLGAVERDDLPVPMVAQPLHEGVAIGQLGVQMPNPTGKGLKPNKPGERRGGRQV